jgi:hypothetical protein
MHYLYLQNQLSKMLLARFPTTLKDEAKVPIKLLMVKQTTQIHIQAYRTLSENFVLQNAHFYTLVSHFKQYNQLRKLHGIENGPHYTASPTSEFFQKNVRSH